MKFIDRALIGTEIQAMFLIHKAYELMRIVSKMNNFNFKLAEHKIPSSTVVSVVDFESDYPGSSPDLDDRFYSNTTNSKFLMMAWQTIEVLI